MEIHIPGQQTIRYTTEEFPLADLDKFRAIIGDGRARVSVTADVGIKDFGTGASSSCTIVLTCNQDAQTINQAATLAAEAARHYAHSNRQLAEDELRMALEQRQQTSR
jgi:hypothetical protein